MADSPRSPVAFIDELSTGFIRALAQYGGHEPPLAGPHAPMFRRPIPDEVGTGDDGVHDGDRHGPEPGAGLRKGCTTTSTATEPACSN